MSITSSLFWAQIKLPADCQFTISEQEYLLDERAGILEFDSGIKREEAEQLAWEQLKEKIGAK